MLACLVSPQAQVNMGAAAGLIQIRLGGKGSEQMEKLSYTTRRLTHEADIIGRA